MDGDSDDSGAGESQGAGNGGQGLWGPSIKNKWADVAYLLSALCKNHPSWPIIFPIHTWNIEKSTLFWA